ncbi:MAG: efflux transporter periplasmic adaptor subunit [Bacilli bacterium]|nr:efflux transporter periplasmic adaptor subunit [Bacilli bacterium]
MLNSARNILITSLVVAIAAGGGGYAYFHKSAKPTLTYLHTTVKKGDLAKVITATGNVASPTTANLSFGTSGKVTKVNVAVGDQVKKGQVLATLDMQALQNAVATAQASLHSAQAGLQALQNGPTDASLAAQQAAVDKALSDLGTAQSNLQTAKQNADQGYLQSQLNAATQSVQTAQANYDAISKAGDATQMTFAKAQLDNATTNYKTALSQLNNLAQLQQQAATAQTAVDTAQRNYDLAVIQLNQLKQPALQTDIDQKQASVQSAQIAFQNAQLNLSQGSLTAPFDGVITNVVPHEGEQIGGSSTAISVMTTENGLQITVPVDDSDISSVKAGQQSIITLDSLPGVNFTGKVSIIAPVGTSTNGITTFPVTIALSASDPNIKRLIPGQNTNVSIVVDSKTGVLTVPDAAIQGQGKNKYVQVYQSATTPPKSVQIQTGLDDDRNTEVISGLTEGQEIVVGTRAAGGSNAGGSNRATTGTGGLGGGGIGGIGGGGFGGGGGGRGGTITTVPKGGGN